MIHKKSLAKNTLPKKFYYKQLTHHKFNIENLNSPRFQSLVKQGLRLKISVRVTVLIGKLYPIIPLQGLFEEEEEAVDILHC